MIKSPVNFSTSLKWVGAFTPLMKYEGFRFDPESRILKPQDAVKFVKTVMQPGFMRDQYTPTLLTPKENKKVHRQIKRLIDSDVVFSFRAGQRAFDAGSSFDLRNMVNQFYQYKNLERKFSMSDLKDPEMKLFSGMPGVAVIGAQSFPEFELTPIDDLNRIIYAAPGFMKRTIETTRDDSYFKNDGINYLKRANGQEIKIAQQYSFNRIFAEHGLFGYKITMKNFDPLTALGGMGMSNHVVFSAMTMASILTQAKKDIGQLFAEAGHYENEYLNGLTGFQEMMQALFNGTGILIYAYNYYGGIGRQLLPSTYAEEIEKKMKLVLYNRITGDPRRPVNETWTAQAANPLFQEVYRAMLDISWAKEILPFLKATASGSPINFQRICEGYLEHAYLRYLACQDYFGNEGERAFIIDQGRKGNTVFPLGEGSNNSTKLFIGGPDFNPQEFAQTFPVLKRKDALRALKVKGTITTGQVPFKMLNQSFELGSGFYQIHGGKAVPAPLITIVEGED